MRVAYFAFGSGITGTSTTADWGIKAISPRLRGEAETRIRQLCMALKQDPGFIPRIPEGGSELLIERVQGDVMICTIEPHFDQANRPTFICCGFVPGGHVSYPDALYLWRQFRGSLWTHIEQQRFPDLLELAPARDTRAPYERFRQLLNGFRDDLPAIAGLMAQCSRAPAETIGWPHDARAADLCQMVGLALDTRYPDVRFGLCSLSASLRMGDIPGSRLVCFQRDDVARALRHPSLDGRLLIDIEERLKRALSSQTPRALEELQRCLADLGTVRPAAVRAVGFPESRPASRWRELGWSAIVVLMLVVVFLISFVSFKLLRPWVDPGPATTSPAELEPLNATEEVNVPEEALEHDGVVPSLRDDGSTALPPGTGEGQPPARPMREPQAQRVGSGIRPGECPQNAPEEIEELCDAARATIAGSGDPGWPHNAEQVFRSNHLVFEGSDFAWIRRAYEDWRTRR